MMMKKIFFLFMLLMTCRITLDAQSIRYRHISHTNTLGVVVSPVQGGVGTGCIYVFDGNVVRQRLSGGDRLWEYSHSDNNNDYYYPVDGKDMDGVLVFSKDRKQMKWIKYRYDGRRSMTIGERVD